MSYLMESEAEAKRLLAQEATGPTRELLRSCGLREGHSALDAGCGPGGISREMAAIVGVRGQVVGVDASAARLSEARRQCEPFPHARFMESDIRKIELADASVDFAWSQFVFEYLPDPERALAELIRITRPGGKVVVSDVDGVGQMNWPAPPEVEQGFQKLVKAAATTGFDIHVGRKLFHMFRRSGLRDIKVRVETLWMVAGSADVRVLEDWTVRLQALAKVAIPEFGSEAAYASFCGAYLDLLRDPDSLKYTVYLVTEGTK